MRALNKNSSIKRFAWFNLSISNIQTGQNSNKGVTMATSHGSPPPDTCHAEFSGK